MKIYLQSEMGPRDFFGLRANNHLNSILFWSNDEIIVFFTNGSNCETQTINYTQSQIERFSV